MYIHVRVTAGAKKEQLRKTKKDHFEAVVTEKAERNMANRKVIALIACHYKVSIGKVRIVTGHHAPSKIVAVDI